MKDDLYYATMEYTEKPNYMGSYILLASKEKNVLLSFQTKYLEDIKGFDEEVIKILEEITFSPNVSENSNSYDDFSNNGELSQYYDLIKNAKGKKVKLKGEWITLEENPTIYVFDKNEFWLYHNPDIRNDNYYHGTTKIYHGEDALEKLGITEDEAKSQLIDKDNYEQIYYIECTVDEYIIEGKDKSVDEGLKGVVNGFLIIMDKREDDKILAEMLNIVSYKTYTLAKSKD